MENEKITITKRLDTFQKSSSHGCSNEHFSECFRKCPLISLFEGDVVELREDGLYLTRKIERLPLSENSSVEELRKYDVRAFERIKVWNSDLKQYSHTITT